MIRVLNIILLVGLYSLSSCVSSLRQGACIQIGYLSNNHIVAFDHSASLGSIRNNYIVNNRNDIVGYVSNGYILDLNNVVIGNIRNNYILIQQDKANDFQISLPQ